MLHAACALGMLPLVCHVTASRHRQIDKLAVASDNTSANAVSMLGGFPVVCYRATRNGYACTHRQVTGHKKDMSLS